MKPQLGRPTILHVKFGSLHWVFRIFYMGEPKIMRNTVDDVAIAAVFIVIWFLVRSYLHCRRKILWIFFSLLFNGFTGTNKKNKPHQFLLNIHSIRCECKKNSTIYLRFFYFYLFLQHKIITDFLFCTFFFFCIF